MCSGVRTCMCVCGWEGVLCIFTCFFFKVILFVMLALPIQKKKWNRTRVYKILSWTDNHYRTTLAYFRGTTIFWGIINFFSFLSMGYSLPLDTLVLPISCRRVTDPGSHIDNWNKLLLIPSLTPKLQHTSWWLSGRNQSPLLPILVPKPILVPVKGATLTLETTQGEMHGWWFQRELQLV